MKEYIKLVIMRPSGHRTEVTIKGYVTPTMFLAAEKLLQAMSTGKPRKAKR